jgi:hypothetical protein
MGVSGQFHSSATLLSEKDPRYLFDGSLGGPQSRPGRGGAEKNIPAPAGN